MIEYGTDAADDDQWLDVDGVHGTGCDTLNEVAEFLGRYVVFPAHALTAVTLWAAHTHLVDAFDSTPRLSLLSPEKQCGKSRVLELLEPLCAGAETLSDSSASYLYRRIGGGRVTILLDEADAIWKRGKSDEQAEALRSVINAGHRKAARVGRVEMNGKTPELKRFPVYAPAALAGIGDCIPDTVLDRSLVVRMRRRAPGEKVDSYRERTVRPDGEKLGLRLAAWADAVRGQVGDPWPEMPAGVDDRPADVWEPLVACADLAGGQWPDAAREACRTFVVNAEDSETTTIGVRLLGDLRTIFGEQVALSTTTILERLYKIDEAPWSHWYGRQFNPRDLAKLLKPYGAEPKVVRLDHETTARGYHRDDLADAWSRYLAQGSVTEVTSVTPLASTVTDVTAVTDTPANGEEPLDEPTANCCYGGTVQLRCQLCAHSPTHWRAEDDAANS